MLQHTDSFKASTKSGYRSVTVRTFFVDSKAEVDSLRKEYGNEEFFAVRKDTCLAAYRVVVWI